MALRRTRLDARHNRKIVKLTWVFKVKRDGKKKENSPVRAGLHTTAWSGLRSDLLRRHASRVATPPNLHRRQVGHESAALGLRRGVYLQGDLQPGEVVYCSPPPGYTTAASADGTIQLVPTGDGDGVDRLCKVDKPVYGMWRKPDDVGSGPSSPGSHHGTSRRRTVPACAKASTTLACFTATTRSRRPTALAAKPCSSVVTWTICTSSLLPHR